MSGARNVFRIFFSRRDGAERLARGARRGSSHPTDRREPRRTFVLFRPHPPFRASPPPRARHRLANVTTRASMTEVHARVVDALDSRADVPSDSDSDAPREGRGGDPLLDPEEDSEEEEEDDSEERDTTTARSPRYSVTSRRRRKPRASRHRHRRRRRRSRRGDDRARRRSPPPRARAAPWPPSPPGWGRGRPHPPPRGRDSTSRNPARRTKAPPAVEAPGPTWDDDEPPSPNPDHPTRASPSRDDAPSLRAPPPIASSARNPTYRYRYRHEIDEK